MATNDEALWHELLARARRAERMRDALVDAVLGSHDRDGHDGPARWCRSRHCRLADDVRQRPNRAA